MKDIRQNSSGKRKGWPILSIASKLIYLLAAAITLANAVFSILSIRSVFDMADNLPALPVHELPLRIIFCIFLQGCIGWIFGRIMAVLLFKGHGLNIIIIIISALIASWASLINIEWIILQTSPLTVQKQAILFFAGCGALAIDLYLINFYCERLCNKRIQLNSIRFSQPMSRKKGFLFGVRALGFAGMFILLVRLGVLAA